MHRYNPFDVPRNYLELDEDIFGTQQNSPDKSPAAQEAPLTSTPMQDPAEADPAPKRDFSGRQLVVLYKSNCEQDAALQLSDQLQRLKEISPRWAGVKFIPTESNDNHLKHLDDAIGEDTDVVLIGGDGTKSRAMERIHQADHKGLRVVLAGFGTKMDMAYTHGGEHYDDPAYMLEHGEETEHIPLEATFGKGSAYERTLTAFYVLGLGANAITARIADSPEFRAAREARGNSWHARLRTKIHEGWIALDGIMRNPAFRTHHPRTPLPQRGRWQNFMAQYMDMMFAAGPRVAGNAVKMPTQPNNPLEFAMIQTPNRLHRIIGGLVVATTRTANTVGGTYQTYLEDWVRVQKDGEYQGVLPTGVLEVKRSAKAITILSLSPKPIDQDIQRIAAIRNRQSVTLAA